MKHVFPLIVTLLASLLGSDAPTVDLAVQQQTLSVVCARTGSGVAATIGILDDEMQGANARYVVESGPDGRALLPAGLVGRELRLRTRAAGFQGRDEVRTADAASLQVRLDPLAHVTGTVLTPDGAAVPDAEVLLLDFRSVAAVGIERPIPHLALLERMRTWHEADLEQEPTSTRTDSRGRFRIRVPSGLPFEVVARRADLGSARVRVEALAPGEIADVEPRLAPTTGARGGSPPVEDGRDAPWMITLFAVSPCGGFFLEEGRLWSEPGETYRFLDMAPGKKIVVLTRSADNDHEVRWLTAELTSETITELPTPALREGSLRCDSELDPSELPSSPSAQLSLTLFPLGVRGQSIRSHGRFDPRRPLRIRGLGAGQLKLHARLLGKDPKRVDSRPPSANEEVVVTPGAADLRLHFTTARVGGR